MPWVEKVLRVMASLEISPPLIDTVLAEDGEPIEDDLNWLKPYVSPEEWKISSATVRTWTPHRQSSPG